MTYKGAVGQYPDKPGNTLDISDVENYIHWMKSETIIDLSNIHLWYTNIPG